MTQRVVVVSGYFDPIHLGHIEMMQQAKDKGSKLIVIVNSDKQAAMKKGQSFMPAAERVRLIRALDCVDAALISVDNDRTVCRTLELLHPDCFAKGGDQTVATIPEAVTARAHGIELIDGLGEKIQSSSWLLQRSRGEEIKVKADPNA